MDNISELFLCGVLVNSLVNTEEYPVQNHYDLHGITIQYYLPTYLPPYVKFVNMPVTFAVTRLS